MLLSLTILGSGTSVPAPGRRSSAYLVEAGDTRILMDCGSGAVGSMCDAGVTVAEVDGVLLSHLHPDHTADLVPLLFALKNPVCPRRSAPLKIWGPEGTAALLDALRGVYGSWIEPPDCEVQVEELTAEEPFQLGELEITSFSVVHSGASFAFRLQRDDVVVTYSGDTGPCPGLEAAAKGADILVAECSLRAQDSVEGHMNAAQVGQVAAAAEVGQVILTHLYPSVIEGEPAKLCREEFKGLVWLAEDGMVVRLDEEGGIGFRVPESKK